MKTLGGISLFVSAAALLSAQLMGCGDGGDTTGAGGSGSTGSGGSTGAGMAGLDCSSPTDFVGPITADTTLTADTCYLMKGLVFVESGATLTIEPGTTIMGETVSQGTLVIKPGAKIMAEGTADKPILFTSQSPKGQRAAGDWGGVILLGKAPVNLTGGQGAVEGITMGGEFGGTDPNDSSGTLKYVRVEFSGIQLSPDNEINGVTFGGVGAGTTVEYVMVHDTLDDCFEFFGGTVNVKHMLCANNGDDGFDWDNGYTGKMQFLAVIQDPSIADDTNGFEADNDAMGSTNAPISEPTIYNATLVGKNVDVAKQQYGMLLRRSTKAHIFNTIVTGFEAGIDIRDATTSIELKNSIFFGNVVENVAYAEDAASSDPLLMDDDGGFDEKAWFAMSGNTEQDPKLTAPFNAESPDLTPAATIKDNAATPPSDGFFDAVDYIGAFQAGDAWATGAWVDYSRN